MSINKQSITYSSTGKTFTLNSNKLGNITDLIITLDDFTFTESQATVEYLRSQMAEGNVFPLHDVFDINKNNVDPEYKESLQDFTYRSYKGKKIITFIFNWDLTYAQTINQFSGQKNLRVIFGIKHESLYCKNVSDTLNGFKIESIYVEPHEIDTGLIPVRIELSDIDELKDYGYLIPTDYTISDIDRDYVNITVNATSSTMTLSVTHNSDVIEDLVISDVTIKDDINGILTYAVFNESGGIYELGSFSDTLTKGCVIILSEMYLGKQKYYVETVITYTTLELMSGDDFQLMDGTDLLEFMNTQ